MLHVHFVPHTHAVFFVFNVLVVLGADIRSTLRVLHSKIGVHHAEISILKLLSRNLSVITRPV